MTHFSGKTPREILDHFKAQAEEMLMRQGNFHPMAIMLVRNTLMPMVLDFSSKDARRASLSIIQDSVRLYQPDFVLLLILEKGTGREEGSLPENEYLLASIATPRESHSECLPLRREGNSLSLGQDRGDMPEDALILGPEMWDAPPLDLH